jgi:hypothetical protein
VLACDRERLLVALPDLLGRDSLLQAVVAGQQEIVDLLACLCFVHIAQVKGPRPGGGGA